MMKFNLFKEVSKIKIENDKVVMDKEEFVINVLSLGLAINILVDNSEFSK